MMDRLKSMLLGLGWSHVVLFIGAAAALFYYTLDGTPLTEKEGAIASLQEGITSDEGKLQEAKKFEVEFEAKKKDYAGLVSQLQKLQGALPKQFFVPDLMFDFLHELRQLELQVTDIHPDQKESEGELYNSLGFTLDTKGTFLQHFILLDRLANMKRLVHVESFTVEPDGAEGKKITLASSGGAFTSMSGGLTKYPLVRGHLRLITFRYRDSNTNAETKK